MTYLKNFRPSKAFKNNNTLFNAQYKKNLNINYLQILKSTIYIFLHKEEQKLKSKKWKLQTLCRKLIGFDIHTIYRIYSEKLFKVIRIKDL